MRARHHMLHTRYRIKHLQPLPYPFDHMLLLIHLILLELNLFVILLTFYLHQIYLLEVYHVLDVQKHYEKHLLFGNLLILSLSNKYYYYYYF